MKQFTKSFLRLSLLLAIGAMSGLHAASCDTGCSDFSIASCNNNSGNTSCNTSCGTSDCILSSSTCGNCCHSVYISRPTFNNTAYFWFPWRKDIDCEFNGIMELGFEYQRSFSSSHISRALFGRETLHFQGSGIGNSITGAGRDPRALIADNFGLSSLCDTAISFKPRIQNYNLNFHGRLGFDNWVEGLYGEVYFAFTHQNRNLHLDTNVTSTIFSDPCSTGFSNGCSIGCSGFSTGCDTNNSCVTTSTSLPGACGTPFVAGYMAPGVASTVGSLQAALTGATFGDMTQAWSFGKFPFSSQTKNAVSGVALVAGWNFWQSDCGHFGLFFQYVAPTGNTPDARYLFSPVVGNGRHHELGGGLSAHYELWNNDCDQALNVYLDGYVMTALRNCQTRSFDFLGKGCLSRYMLLEALNPGATPPTSPLTYTGLLINGIDFATRRAQVKVSVKGDATLRFVYSHGGWNFGFGYNAYGQSQEDVRLANAPVNNCNGTPVLTAARYGFKGCASLYAAGVTIAPAVTQSGATINLCGVNDATAQFIPDPTVVPPAVSCSGNASDILSTGVLNLESGAAPKQFTNKGFATLDYTWAECDYSPYLGIGGEAEGGSRFSMNQWGVWIKGGIQF